MTHVDYLLPVNSSPCDEEEDVTTESKQNCDGERSDGPITSVESDSLRRTSPT